MLSTARLAGTTTLSLVLALSVATACQKEKSPDGENDDSKKSDDTNTKAGAGKRATLNKGQGHKLPDRKPKLEIPPPPDVAAPPADAKKTASGLAYKVLKTGAQTSPESGDAMPKPEDKVSVNYTGWTTDGKMFDTSQKRKGPSTFGVGQVIKGWTEGLQLMRVGEQFRFWIPEELAYKGKSGPQGMLVFDVELLKVLSPPKAPEDVAKPAKNAKKTKKGVFYKVLTAGTGTEKPREWDKVEVHYSGWTTDGKLFDSSITRGKPATFAVNRVIPGWTDALQQMTTGDKWRVWIPKKLAYDGKPGRPAGMLVFDVEMLKIEKMPEPPKAPKNVKAPPRDAKKTASGVFYKILSPTQGDKPTAADTVKVHYTGWTTDGKMFDSSVTRGAPASFPLGGVVPGWRDGLQEIRVGEKARLWIPEELAYKGKKGAPQGMLVFDIELLEIAAKK